MAKSNTKALARRPARSFPGASLAPHKSKPEAKPPAAPRAPKPSVSRVLTEDVDLDTLGLVELKLTAKEESTLSRAVAIKDIRVLPSGVPYLSHPWYTRLFNEAFGRLGWALRPVAKPRLAETVVMVPYVLYIHGKPVAFAWGEQEYHPKNRQQTYGDATEATVASALRRCAKHMGIGLEMWDRPFLDDYLKAECVMVKCRKDGDTVYQWRRRIDKALPGELGSEPHGAAEPDYGDAEHAGGQPRASVPISEKQLRRLYAIITNSGRDEDAVKAWVRSRYGLDHLNQIARHDYDAICDTIAGEGKLQ